MDVNPVYEDLITDLVASKDGLPPYSLYQKYQIQPSQLASFLTDMMEKGYVALDGDMIVATPEGKEAFGDIATLQKPEKAKDFSSDYFEDKQISVRRKVNEPYMPSVVTIYRIIQDREKETSSKE